MTKLAAQIPPYCAGCFGRPDNARWVDFEAAYDGPVIPGSPAHVPVDDLILCENCLRAGAELVGMSDPGEMAERVKDLEQSLAEKEAEIEAKDKALSHADFTIGHLIDAEKAVKRPMGKPQLHGPKSHEKDLKQLRKNRAAIENRGGANKKRSEAAKQRHEEKVA